MSTILPTYEPTIKPEKKTTPLLNCRIWRDDEGVHIKIKSEIIGTWMKKHAIKPDSDNPKDYDLSANPGWEGKMGYKVQFPEPFNAQFSGWGQSWTTGPNKVVNLSFLRAKGLDTEVLQFDFKEVATEDQINKFVEDFKKSVAIFQKQCVAKKEVNITLIMEETLNPT